MFSVKHDCTLFGGKKMAQDKTLSVLEEINARLSKLKETDLTPVENDEGDDKITVIGEMTDHLKRLHTLRDKIADEGNTLAKRLKDLALEAKRIKDLHHIVDRIFWVQLERDFPELKGKLARTIRAPWKVGWFEPDHKGTLADLFRDFAEAKMD